MKLGFGFALLVLLVCLGANVGSAETLADLPPPPPAPVLRPAITPVNPPAREDAKPREEKEPEFDENDTVRVSTSLITVPAEVLDRSGRYIGHLK